MAMWWNDKYKEEIKELKRKIDAFDSEKRMDTQIRIDNQKLTTTNKELTDKINKVNSKLREQTEADLYLQCAKTMKKIERGFCKEKDELIKEMENIDRMTVALYSASAQQNIQSLQSGYYGPFGGALGLQNVFGKAGWTA
jgi:hypothetical protein